MCILRVDGDNLMSESGEELFGRVWLGRVETIRDIIG